MENNPTASTELNKPSPAETLVMLAKLKYEIIRTLEGDLLAIPLTGPKIAKPFKGMQNTLGDDLMSKYREMTHKIPSERAINDALRVLASDAYSQDPVKAHLRYARFGEHIYIDIGDTTGNAIEIRPGSWSIVERPPVYFRRTILTAPLSRPVSGGNIANLFTIINVPTHLQSLLVGWLVASMDPSIPHPILAVNGEQGSGKSFASSKISSLVDPSPAPLQSPPKDITSWIELAAGAYGISLDNLSKISDVFSDALCRASTGDSSVKRANYSDKDLVLHQFKRVIIINGINLMEMRDDLADRIIPMNLPVISHESKQYESYLNEQWEQLYPEILGGLLDLCAKALERLPDVKLSSLPRMADFARVLQALDEICDTESLTQYREEIGKSASNSIDNDTFLKALGNQIESSWTGTASELLDEMSSKTPYHVDKTWPQNSRQVTDKLARSAPTLRKVGWLIENLGSKNHSNAQRWMITPPASLASHSFTLYTKDIEGKRSEAS